MYQVYIAAMPRLPSRQFDAIVCRHVLWALPKPPQVLERWAGLLKRRGRLVLIDGFWSTGGGLHAQELVEALPSSLTHISVQNLGNQPALWGGEVTGERCAIIADLRA